jgi:phosphoglycerate dehydrogenase-like enzyme
MPPNATFINTGRGATVRESELIEVLAARSDLNALLDVTDPEPPLPDSPLWEMKNVVLTSHIAGSIGDEVVRMADYMIEEFESWLDGKPTRFSVSEAMLETMA